jgi:hypothetical protein
MRPAGATPPEGAEKKGIAGKGVAGRKRGCSTPLTTETNVGAAPEAISAAKGEANVEKKDEAKGGAAVEAAARVGTLAVAGEEKGEGTAGKTAPREEERGVSATEREVASRMAGPQAEEPETAKEPTEEEEEPEEAKVNAELELIAIQPCVRIEFNVTNSKDCCPIYWRERNSHFITRVGRGCPAQSWQFPAGENPEQPELQTAARRPDTARRVCGYDITQ